MPERIRKHLVDKFSETVLNGAIIALNDTANPIRGNLFALAIRELLTHTIHFLAPDDDVKTCPWFRAEIEDGRPTRRQRFQYMIHGGINTRYVQEEYNLDVDTLLTSLTRAFETLNRATHLREGTVINEGEEIEDLKEEIFSAFEDLFNTINDCRYEAMQAASDDVSEEVINEAISNTIPTIDLLATHYYINRVGIEEISTIRIDADYIWYKASGEIDAILQYGSSSDREKDMGAEIPHSFPYQCELPAPVKSPQKIETSLIKMEVDDGGWFDEE